MAKKTVDPLKEKEKKQKILLAVLGVLFVGILAFTGPKTWKRLHPPAAPAASTPTTTTAAPPAGTPTLAAPTLAGSGEGPAATSSPGSLADSPAPALQDGQLASFSRFASKDPFAQQLSDEKGSSTSSSKSGSSGSSSSTGSSGPSGGSIPEISGNAPTPGTAVISVNATLYTVTVGEDFPATNSTDPTAVPLFHLVSLTLHSAKISIVGGAYADGAKTITLKENKALTLMNTADGTRYKLILKPQGTDTGADTSAGTTATTPTVTLPPATP
jgi:hypothetical protein